MRKISIPLTQQNFEFLRKEHPEEITASVKDVLASAIEAIIKNNAYLPKKNEEKIDRTKFPQERLIFYNENKWRKSSGSKLTMDTVRKINNMLDFMLKQKFIKYCEELRKEKPDVMHKECIEWFCEGNGLTYDQTFYQSLKKYDYRNRIKIGK